MPERSRDWIVQAQRDLESARAQLRDDFSEWACFISQQAAEKAVKAVFQKLGAEAWGHSVTDLLKGLQEKIAIPSELIDKAKKLDRFYIPARYPNGWVSGTPAEYITKEDAQDAISNSEKIVQFCKSFLVK
ncbi:MAG: HEPN domain-containing protein [Candidatus Omnitrophota bacterium]